ncbi:uncharacterized protein LOC106012446 [Aplysia californica]|uniref:Uncharacterized protein LOC106012446 n=1 Tax=Aplysia californica TaxID=6500 RepID=A0ABM1A4W8_APLCA|nr:uncharacterized protein LOC106012446 [Aplysia californica]
MSGNTSNTPSGLSETSSQQMKTPRSTNGASGQPTRGNTRNTKLKTVSRNTTPVTPRSWVTYNSPLWRKDCVKSKEQLSHSMPTTPRILSRMETGFVNDAINTHILSSRRNPIIPQYDALSDKYAQAYFKSPFVQGIMEKNNALVTLKDLKSQRTVNKLSVRRRCKQTPDVNEIRQRETRFVNDAIITEKKRNKYKDIIPPYDARDDKLCKAYFQRGDIKRLVDRTCSTRTTHPQKGVLI